jgi:hypothetical protein
MAGLEVAKLVQFRDETNKMAKASDQLSVPGSQSELAIHIRITRPP